MGDVLRRHLTFACEGATLVGTLDAGDAATGLLIVSGGNEIRMGAHRGMAMLAQDIAGKGYPVFRFDRRGIGDSGGDNGGFRSSQADIAAALYAFRTAAPQLRRIVAFGNCDAATALVLHQPDVDALVLANPWVIETDGDLPAPAAIRDRYSRRLRDPGAWAALATGKLDLKAAIRGLAKIAAPEAANGLASEFARALCERSRPTTLLLAARDNTAIAFARVWAGPVFAQARTRSDIRLVAIDSASHSFANEADYAALVETLLQALG